MGTCIFLSGQLLFVPHSLLFRSLGPLFAAFLISVVALVSGHGFSQAEKVLKFFGKSIGAARPLAFQWAYLRFSVANNNCAFCPAA